MAVGNISHPRQFNSLSVNTESVVGLIPSNINAFRHETIDDERAGQEAAASIE